MDLEKNAKISIFGQNCFMEQAKISTSTILTIFQKKIFFEKKIEKPPL